MPDGLGGLVTEAGLFGGGRLSNGRKPSGFWVEYSSRSQLTLNSWFDGKTELGGMRDTSWSWGFPSSEEERNGARHHKAVGGLDDSGKPKCGEDDTMASRCVSIMECCRNREELYEQRGSVEEG